MKIDSWSRWIQSDKRIEIQMTLEKERIPPGLWAPIPIPAIKFLVSKGHRSASRILYAIVLHKGKAESAIFPSYETLALYACVGENNIRAALDVLEKYKFISIKKSRVGKKSRNEYKILDRAYTLDLNPKSKKSKAIGTMICNTCWQDVPGYEIAYERSKDWEGNWSETYIHMTCQGIGGYSHCLQVTERTRENQLFQKAMRSHE
jgi:hypothetical protein